MKTPSDGSVSSQLAPDELMSIATRFLTTLRNRDWSSMRSLFWEDATWSLPGSSLISGKAEGVDAVIQKAQLIVSYGVNFHLNHFLYGMDGVALSLHNTASRDHAVLDEYLATVCTIVDGRIAAINTYLSDVELVNAFFIYID